MKKLIFVGLILVASFSLFAQTADKIETEYYGLKWGCSPTELKAKYPSAYNKGKNDNGDEVYCLDANDAVRVFSFGNNKLYWGRIIYDDCTVDKAMALTQKIVDTYGKFDDSSRGDDYITFTKHYSSRITIRMEVKTSGSCMITYTNNILNSQITKDRIEKMQGDLEI